MLVLNFTHELIDFVVDTARRYPHNSEMDHQVAKAEQILATFYNGDPLEITARLW